jgi:hypothetical protein
MKILKVIHKNKIVNVRYDVEDHDKISKYVWYIDHGYARATIYTNGIKSSILMHRLILNTNTTHTHHINGDRVDNRKVNILSISAKDHAQYHDRKQFNTSTNNAGWFKPGIQGITTKLSEQDVNDIRNLYTTGLSIRKIARLFNMGNTAIACIVRRKTWKHI